MTVSASGSHETRRWRKVDSNFQSRVTRPDLKRAGGVGGLRAHPHGRRPRGRCDPDYPHLPYGTDAKPSLIARAILSRDGIKKVSFLPVLIDKQLRPEILRRIAFRASTAGSGGGDGRDYPRNPPTHERVPRAARSYLWPVPGYAPRRATPSGPCSTT